MPCVLCPASASETVLTTEKEISGRLVAFRLERCASCGLVRAEPRLEEDVLAAAYPRRYFGSAKDRDADWLQRDQAPRTCFVARHLDRGRVLDVGCGLGLFLSALDPERFDVCGLEPMAAPHAAAAARLGHDRVVHGDLDAAPWADGTFDAITMWDVLEHTSDPRAALGTIHRLLRPGGVLLLTVPNFGGWQARRFGEDWYALSLPHHLWHMTADALTRLLGAAGFALLSLEDRAGREDRHALRHSRRAQLRRRFGGRFGTALYYVMRPTLRPWAWLTSRVGGGSRLTVAARRLEVGP